jgi:uncharacterized SAM-binding protein YcdF (DUF218 family)
MHSLVELIKAGLLPGSTSFLVFGLAIGVLLLVLGRKSARWGTGWLIALLASYVVLSLPIVAGAMESALADGYQPIGSAEQAKGAGVIVVLAGGSATYRASGQAVESLGEAGALRVLEAARLYKLLGSAQVIASGGPGGENGEGDPESGILKAALVAAGVPASQITEEPASTDTHEQALAIAAMLRPRGNLAFVLVTSPTHMRRASTAMRAQGLDPIPSPSRQHSESPGPGGSGWLPGASALNASTLAVREVLAWIYYWERGWLAAGSP